MTGEPRRIRLMVDDVSGIAFWDDEGGLDDDDLPVPGELLARIRAWVDDYTETVGGRNHWWRHSEFVEHDGLGYRLSLELQAALGADFLVKYFFETQEVRRAMQPKRRPAG